jgi:hypothetical protein
LNFENTETLHSLVIVMSGSHVLNLQSQSIFENERCLNSKNATLNSHFQSFNYCNDFNFQEEESIPIYDYEVIQIPMFCHDLELFTQINVISIVDYIILVDTCEKEILVNKSLVSFNILVNSNVDSLLNTKQEYHLSLACYYPSLLI